jgi:hypothetical protein
MEKRKRILFVKNTNEARIYLIKKNELLSVDEAYQQNLIDLHEKDTSYTVTLEDPNTTLVVRVEDTEKLDRVLIERLNSGTERKLLKLFKEKVPPKNPSLETQIKYEANGSIYRNLFKQNIDLLALNYDNEPAILSEKNFKIPVTLQNISKQHDNFRYKDLEYFFNTILQNLKQQIPTTITKQYGFTIYPKLEDNHLSLVIKEKKNGYGIPIAFLVKWDNEIPALYHITPNQEKLKKYKGKYGEN